MAEGDIEGLAARKVAATVLTRVIDDHRNLDSLIDQHHGIDPFLKLDVRDRRLVRAILTTALRHHRQIEAGLGLVMDRKPPKNARHLIHTLHVAAAQILFMDVPESAAVNLAVTAISKEKRSTRFKNLANAVLRRMTREKADILEKLTGKPSLPDWFFKRLRKDFGKARAEEISAMVQLEPMLDISVKSEPEKWAERLGGIVLPTGTVRVSDKTNVRDLDGYGDGEWWVQDAASALPVRLMGAVSGKKVLELCAAPGGKTAQLASAGAELTAVEISAPRLVRLQENLDRLKLHANLVQADLLEWEPSETFDAILLDAPCSSTGTIRRHPDVPWTKSETDIDALAKLQQQMLEKAAAWVKPGGVFVFANCSMLKQEGEDMLAGLPVSAGLQRDPIQPEELPGMSEAINGQGALRALPNMMATGTPEMSGMDGFFAARFIKQ